jgi:hypothetical protein
MRAHQPARSALGRAFARTAVAALAFALLPGCLHAQKKKADVEALREATETFHKLARWSDLKSTARFLAPELRIDFLKAVIDRNDDETLKITDYELEDAQIGEDTATVLSKITWHRLPSVTTKTEAMALVWEDREGVWVVTAIEGGPFPIEAKPKPGGLPAAR